jgi:hypothetical protein
MRTSLWPSCHKELSAMYFAFFVAFLEIFELMCYDLLSIFSKARFFCVYFV